MLHKQQDKDVSTEIGFHDALNHPNGLLYFLGVAFLNNPQDLAALSLTCRECCICLRSLLLAFRDKTWHSSHVCLLPSSLSSSSSSEEEDSTRRHVPAECVTGVAHAWTSRKHVALVEFYDQQGLELKPLAVLHSGDHHERFNALHGYCTLARRETDFPDRYRTIHE